VNIPTIYDDVEIRYSLWPMISTLAESAIPWVYSLQFLFRSTRHSQRYERKCEWVFFSSVFQQIVCHFYFENYPWL